MDWKQKLLEAHAHDERAWRLSLALRAHLRERIGDRGAGQAVLVAPGDSGQIAIVDERGELLVEAPESSIRMYGSFRSQDSRLARPVRDSRSASVRGRMAMEFRRRLASLSIVADRRPAVEAAVAAADATYWAFAALMVPRVRAALPHSEDAEQELLLRAYQLAMRVDPFLENVAYQARAYARRGLVPLGLRVAFGDSADAQPRELPDVLVSPLPTPEERVQASEEAQRGLIAAGFKPVGAAAHLARQQGLSELDIASRLDITPRRLRAVSSQHLPAMRFRRCAMARCRRLVGSSGRRGLCQRCLRRERRERLAATGAK